MTVKNYNDAIEQIARREFGAAPTRVIRITEGICNEIYSVAIGDREYIFRLNAEPRFMLGSRDHIPLFRSKGIVVPQILAEDYTRSWVPVAFQIQNKLPGIDIGEVIHTLSDKELVEIGGEVANVFRQLASVPNNGKFGVLWGDDKDLVDSWSAEVERVIRVVKGWGKKTGVLDQQLEAMLDRVFAEYKPYFEGVRSYTYFGDIAGKNVMVDKGRFSGLVDLDSLGQGDPLEAIGRVKASWYGTNYGLVYSNAVMDSLGLPEQQRRVVTMYALLNRIFRTLENGVKLGKKTDVTVDREREALDKLAVVQLYTELYGESVHPTEPQPEPRRTPHAIRRAANERPRDVVPDEVSLVSISEPQPQPEVEPLKQKPRPVRKPKQVPESVEIVENVPQPIPHVEIESPPVPTDPEIIAPVEPAVQIRPRPDAANTRPMLEAGRLSKTYVSDGIGFNALSNVDLQIHPGDCVAIVGKSGSGKSTLMHLLACLDGATEGYVYVDGDDTSTMSEPEKNQLRNEKFGFVFQQFFLNGRDTVFENVVLPLRIRGASDYEMTTEAEEALAAVGLTDKTDKKAKDLSGGEKQRVCIARALVGKPQVIFADEPTGNLDSNTGGAIEKMLFDLNRDKGITLVIVTHDGDLARRCDRIIEMKDGRIVGERRGEDLAQ